MIEDFSESTASRVVRFAEWLADKLANGKAVQAFEPECFSTRCRLSRQEAAARYSAVLADVRNGAAVSIACKRHKAGESSFRQWAGRKGHKIRKARK